MDLAQYRRINTIIERDSTDATYKYALLRGVIEICQQSSHLREDDGEQVSFPLGLLVEKWLLYYYPIFAAPAFIPQKNGETPDQDAGKVVSFRKHFMPVIDYYRDRGGISVFYNDYARGTMPAEIQPAFGTLAKAIRTTITKMPMKHLGYSQSKEHYSVFDYDRSYRLSRESPADRTSLIENSGRFFLSRDLCTIFEHFGGFISGEECLLKKWAEFTAAADRTGTVTEECMLSLLTRTPTTERAIADARNIYQSVFAEERSLVCVWSGRPINSPEAMHIDHVLPFSVWKNNDLWNLLPALGTINAHKHDRIPDPALLESRRDCIIGYWDFLHDHAPRPFEREIAVSLLGLKVPQNDWQDLAFNHLAEQCAYLIHVRGYEAWAI
ncbi:HNH endonuclease domain-containing protein [Methanoculleus sp.]|uniref:HNH endonuclease domain-containing protein n=1 Tax=Methanoculleus sp. TaxID=90427 RepID=UPI002D17DBF7|nr:HNH endonuclease domain-containing protein [Methanoculleus sp.]HNT08660.1 HNH endonuclease domain-containing protein [Methanoculleus sp.]